MMILICSQYNLVMDMTIYSLNHHIALPLYSFLAFEKYTLSCFMCILLINEESSVEFRCYGLNVMSKFRLMKAELLAHFYSN